MYEEQSLGFKKKYRLEWIPSLVRKGKYGTYIIGRNPSLGATLGNQDDLNKTGNYITASEFSDSGTTKVQGVVKTASAIQPRAAYPHILSIPQILERSFFDSIVCTFNNNICLASDYSIQTQTKNVIYTTLAGNSVTTFGQAPKKLGLKLVVLKKGHFWESYCKGLEAMHFISANKTRFLGAFFLNGFDTAPVPDSGNDFYGNPIKGNDVYSVNPSSDYNNGTKVSSRYKVTIDSVNFNYRADKNTMIDGDIQFTVLYDYNLAKLPLQSRFGML